MLDQLIQLVEQQAGSTIVNNSAIPDQHNNAAIKEVAQQIFNGLQNQATSGNLSQLTSLFQGGTSNVASNPIVNQLVSSVANSVATKFGVSSQAAQSMASNLLPTVINQLVSKTNNPNDSSFDLGNMMKTFTGNSNFDVSGMIGQLSGGGGIGGIALGRDRVKAARRPASHDPACSGRTRTAPRHRAVGTRCGSAVLPFLRRQDAQGYSTNTELSDGKT